MSFRHRFCFILLSFVVFSVSAEEMKIVADSNLQPYFGPQKPIMGKNLWNHAPVVGVPFQKELREVAKEPMTQVSLAVTPYLGKSLFESDPPLNTRLLIREIELFDSSGRNRAPDAAVSGEAKNAEVRYPGRVNDGDSSLRSLSYSAPPKQRENQEGAYTFEFKAPVALEKAVIKSGRPRSESDKEYAQIISDFSIQIPKDGKWIDLPGGIVKNNDKPECEVVFQPVTTKTVRVVLYGQASVMKVSIKKFASIPIPGDRPFILNVNASRLPYNCFENYSVDKTGFNEWKKAHPDFLGFYVAEWGWDFMNFINFKKTGNLEKQLKDYGASAYLIRKADDILADFNSREKAMKYFRAYYDAIRKHYFNDPKSLCFIDCSRALSHYAMDWGCNYYLIETTASGYHRHQVQMYFIRGASHQFGVPWGWYIAVGMNHANGYTDPDYLGKWSMGKAGGAGGISPSLNRRDRYLAWFAGAGLVMNEVWPYAYCEDPDKNGVWTLSPHGKVMKEWYDFTQKHSDRGVSYAPVALGLQYDHFVSPINGGKIFGTFPQERGDLMTEGILRTIVPYKFGLSGQEWSLSETPYGDICEVILPDTPKGPVGMNVLRNYRVLFLSGKFDPDRAFAARLMEYVRKGGTLVINTSQLGKNLPPEFLGVQPTGEKALVANPVLSQQGKEVFRLPAPYEFEKVKLKGAEPLLTDSQRNVLVSLNRYGKGNVILTTPDDLIPKDTGDPNTPSWAKWGRDVRFPFMDWLMERISREVLPLSVHGKIQYGLNVVKDGLLLYLINNYGIQKTALTEQKIDPTQTVSVQVDLRKLNVKEVTELRSEKKIAVRPDHTFEVTVPPGEVAVIRIPCGALP